MALTTAWPEVGSDGNPAPRYDVGMAHTQPPVVTTPALGCATRAIQRWRGDHGDAVNDVLAEEVPVAMIYNDRSFAVMMATPCDLEDFARGFSLSEGLIEHADQLQHINVRPLLEGIALEMSVADSARGAHIDQQDERLLPGRSGCGICGTRQLENAVRQPGVVATATRFPHRALQRALGELPPYQHINQNTGAVHAAAWADTSGSVKLVREDVGRHNALDKLIGAMSRVGVDPAEGFALITSRASYEMVTKAAAAGIGLLAAISAPTVLAVELARRAGITLVGFLRAGGHNVYCHPQRLRSEATGDETQSSADQQ